MEISPNWGNFPPFRVQVPLGHFRKTHIQRALLLFPRFPFLAALMPTRRLRVSPRVVKRAMPRYNAKGKVDRTTYQATIDIAILPPP